MENRVQHELQFRTARAEHRIEARCRLRERRLRLRLHHPHAHEQPARERDASRRDERRERVLAQRAIDDQRQRHDYLRALWKARLRSRKSCLCSNNDSTLSSWLTSSSAAPCSRQTSPISPSDSRACFLSRLPVGSSASTSFGWFASARATA